ncbi:MAG: membrane protein insertion efficiency factor YidD [Candidatus Cloacimonadaceae bacterium]|nr:membrane protein insertion efficiency factor YidD [Candidatus Cloacimonadota bacterium]MCB5277455.1 membrane protein insertion efficiency factor YidD [Candidatus Cloacimonadota bacterium]MDD2616441.1 membrane protein insertion efficiency factor YidD [Candidatus Cloacimonadota bacterium]MDD2718725.1 membrane protein insertion efficiency factor YidD [Candidatus Cloacimonadota bacterium]MDD3547245.1 membrane protein insertion efficiency factor YidD [Candidatus Cloacimonadota bacterium]
MILLIRFYQIVISPYLPKSCRFNPSCSTYAIQAFQRYNPVKALYLSTWRVLRCNPFCKGGYDPLP